MLTSCAIQNEKHRLQQQCLGMTPPHNKQLSPRRDIAFKRGQKRQVVFRILPIFMPFIIFSTKKCNCHRLCQQTHPMHPSLTECTRLLLYALYNPNPPPPLKRIPTAARQPAHIVCAHDYYFCNRASFMVIDSSTAVFVTLHNGLHFSFLPGGNQPLRYARNSCAKQRHNTSSYNSAVHPPATILSLSAAQSAVTRRNVPTCPTTGRLSLARHTHWWQRGPRKKISIHDIFRSISFLSVVPPPPKYFYG